MSGLPFHIPGYYYNSEKKRYFRIISSGQSTPSSNIYTKERLKKGKRFNNISKERTKGKGGNPVFNFSTYLFDRQFSQYPYSCNDDRDYLCAKNLKKINLRQLPVGTELQKIGWLREVNTIILTSKNGDILGCCLTPEDKSGVANEKYTSEGSIQDFSLSRIGLSNNPISSLVCNAMQIFWSTSPSLQNEGQFHISTYNQLLGESNNYRWGSLKLLKTPLCAESIGEMGFAVGGTSKIAIINREGKLTQSLQSKGDVFSLKYLGDNLVIAGCRNKSVLVYDLRTKKECVQRFYHGSSICSMQNLDFSQPKLLVSGLESKISLYDCRFLQSKKRPQSIMSYMGHSNLLERNLALMKNENGSIFSSAGDDYVLRFWKTDCSLPFKEMRVDDGKYLCRDGSWVKAMNGTGWVLPYGRGLLIYEP